MVVALNLMDELERHGGKIDCAALSRLMKTPVVPISAKKRRGFDQLFQAIHQQAHDKTLPRPVEKYDASTRQAVAEIVAALGGADSHSAFDVSEHFQHRDEHERDNDHGPQAKHGHIGGYVDEGDVDFAPPVDWVAIKFLEGDHTMYQAAYLTARQKESIRQAVDGYVSRGRRIHPGIDGLTLVADCRYRTIEWALKETGFLRSSDKHEDISSRIDKVVMNKYLAFPIFLAVMALMFALTFGQVGNFLTDLMDALVNDVLGAAVSGALTAGGAPQWVYSLVMEGIIAGVGGVLVFLPQILLIFLFMSILEDSGYMSRAAFITDKLLRKIGLSGRSFIPMLMGFGCTTTAIIAARGVENERDRRMTIMLTPFMSCGARLPVYGLFTAAFFSAHRGVVVFSLYLLGMLVMIGCGLLLRRTVFQSGDTPFVMELPPYRMPTPVNVLRRLWDRAKDFLTRAGTLIFAMSVVVWFLQSFSPQLQFVTDSSQSLFAQIGGFIAPIFAPLGFGDWRKGVALLSGLVAKEAVVSSLQVLYACTDTVSLAGVLPNFFTPLSAFSFLVFILLYTPCVAALAAMRREMHSTKYTLLGIGLQLATAYIITLLVYQAGLLLGL